MRGPKLDGSKLACWINILVTAQVAAAAVPLCMRMTRQDPPTFALFSLGHLRWSGNEVGKLGDYFGRGFAATVHRLIPNEPHQLAVYTIRGQCSGCV